MPDTALLLTFIAASAALILIPGPNLVYIVTQTMSQGLRAGLAAAIGVETGTLAYVLATVLGVSELIARSAVAFTTLTYAGACYLLCLAVQTLRHPPTVNLPEGLAARSPWRAWRDGAIVNLLNPKVGLFFLAFLPQFVNTGPNSPPTSIQLTSLGLIFLGLALLLDLGYALAGGAASSLIRNNGQDITWLRWPVACVYAALAAFAVVS